MVTLDLDALDLKYEQANKSDQFLKIEERLLQLFTCEKEA